MEMIAFDKSANNLKPVLLFSWTDGHAWGGWGDFVDSFDTIEQAREAAAKKPHLVWQVVDLRRGTSFELEERQ